MSTLDLDVRAFRNQATPSTRSAHVVAMDASISVGLGHLVRLACLRDALSIPTEMLGPVDAGIRGTALRLRTRRVARNASRQTRVIIVDRNFIEANIVAWRLQHARNRIIWIRRGLVTESQALAQSGFLPFADVVIAPGDIGLVGGDPFLDLAACQGKLHTVNVCHAYQVVSLSPQRSRSTVFMSLGAFEKPQRETFRCIRDAVAAAKIPFVWSAYSELPARHGFPARLRVAVGNALRIKSECAASVSEGGYNSLHEAVYLARPALFIPNDGNGRERQSVRILAAKQFSPLVFDASAPGDVEKWLAVIRDGSIESTKEIATHGIFHGGFGQIARIVEEFCINQQS